jgi:uncharacterized phage protein (TIGR01671 family)
MREIKLRVWDKENECWLSSRIHLIGLDGTIWRTCATGDESLDSNRYILVQYTGLHDNGKEIYGGDICEVVSISYGKRIGEVKFYRGCFIISFGEQADGYNSDMLYVPLKVEVIGNIYENPELLS